MGRKMVRILVPIPRQHILHLLSALLLEKERGVERHDPVHVAPGPDPGVDVHDDAGVGVGVDVHDDARRPASQRLLLSLSSSGPPTAGAPEMKMTIMATSAQIYKYTNTKKYKHTRNIKKYNAMH